MPTVPRTWPVATSNAAISGCVVTSKAYLHQRIESFVTHFNATMVNPFRSTMNGKPLAV